ncbi:monocarboxylate transporter 14-like [Pectinophora gossypiella]|uniref:monocarboxylate transporter 14-like n=1 Tax=Pectinophora gossypiella TaxID=13191 RepID=UPI00214E10B3|nr:monocarboxylate transporter 14-like [Pectinophora gossypiella]
MEQEFEQNVRLRNNRTPKNKELDNAVRESLLSDSTSGIVKGEDDDVTSIESSSFSSIDMGDKRERALTVVSKDDLQRKNSAKDKTDQSKENHVTITENPGEEKINLIEAKDVNGTVKEDDDDDDDEKVSIPDGGWGWVVVLSSFIISMIADGISFSFGLLYIEFLDEFQASKSTTAWIGSLFIAVPLLSGPVMSALVDRYGCRSMTILGGIISTIGFVLASISTTLEMMMITFGVIAGLGLGLVYVTAVVSIAYWFEKKRNLAVGLGACGTGVGTFVYAPMTQYFIEEYGWRGAILLLSGTLLNLCVCGCVMRDPEWWTLEQKKSRDEEKSKKDEEKSKKSSTLSINAYAFDFDAPTKGKSMKGLIERGLPAEKVIRTEAASIKRHQFLLSSTNKESTKSRCESMVDIPTYLTFNDKISMRMLDKLVKNTSKDYNMEVRYPSFAINRTRFKSTPTSPEMSPQEDNSPPAVAYVKQTLHRTHSDKYDFKKEKSFEEYQLKNPRQAVIRQSKSEDSKELIKQDSKENRRDWLKKQLSVNHHYLKDLKMPINSISHRNAMLNINRYRLKASSCPDIFKNSMITIKEDEEKWYDDCVSCLSDMFNVELFKKPTFNLLCLGTIILFIWFIVPYFYLAEHMIHKGYNEDDGALVLSLIGITNTIGMVGLGWIGDFPSVSIGNLYAVCLVLCGASVASIPFAVYNYWLLLAVAAAFGLLFAASFTFTPSLLVKLVSLDDFTAAYGLVLLAQGIGHLIGPPLSGLIYDVTFSWELSFYLAGGWIVVAGLLIAFIQPALNYYARRREDADNRSESSLA